MQKVISFLFAGQVVGMGLGIWDKKHSSDCQLPTANYHTDDPRNIINKGPGWSELVYVRGWSFYEYN